ncbi:ABC transporter permease [Paenibacillus sp. UNC499MF]|uniref:ABC transporter permease n=1 Tax=Paenibacillus sp. UNC499MF TaxID=1502751 RepID=UPI00089F98C1|nr:ABC transporter permease [Paenibacillus sp. UNC499MF]SEF50807.1 putative ABC transport system permease protein [Paenibacillus sp. UNC499MF]
MSVFQVIWRNALHRKTLSVLTMLSVALTAALLLFVLMWNEGVEKGAEKGYGPFELTMGAEGSKTQLAMSTYYHIGAPTGNIPNALYEEVKKEPEAEEVFAVTTGDNLNGYPIVGVDARYFAVRYGDKQLASGSLYGGLGEAVIGSHAARTLGLKVGDTFKGGHGLVHSAEEAGEHAGEHHEEESGSHADESHEGEHAGGQGGHDEHEGHEAFMYKVVGILPPLHSPDDRAVFTTLDYAWAVHGEAAQQDREVTALMVKPKSLLGAQSLKNKYDAMTGLQAMYTGKAVADVVNVVDKGTQVVQIVTYLCVLLAALTLLLSLLAAASERRKDVALLRLIGKPGRYVWTALVGEGVFLTAGGLLAGLLLGHSAGAAGSSLLFDFAGIQIDPWSLAPGELILAGGAVLLGIGASAIPAWQVYRVDPLHLFRS